MSLFDLPKGYKWKTHERRSIQWNAWRSVYWLQKVIVYDITQRWKPTEKGEKDDGLCSRIYAHTVPSLKGMGEKNDGWLRLFLNFAPWFQWIIPYLLLLALTKNWFLLLRCPLSLLLQSIPRKGWGGNGINSKGERGGATIKNGEGAATAGQRGCVPRLRPMARSWVGPNDRLWVTKPRPRLLIRSYLGLH